MALSSGTKLGPYEIQSPLGAGGMGEVYRARDTRLNRIVAIKILPPHLSKDATLRQRFENEAKAISSLNHPHICALYDVGHQDGTHFLVMEYIKGETLATRLEKGPLPLEPLLKYGIQIADALDKAHRRGVVHRDLKPGNIMLTASGVKLLDFGLAKAMNASPVSELTLSPTSPAAGRGVTQPVTAAGMVVGTFQYMSPEQVEGKDVDARSDIFSFGAVLYEMVTGRRAFQGKSQLSVASAVLEKDPEPISTLQPLTPPALERAVKRCLEKDAEDRWQTARDLELELKWIAEGGAQPRTLVEPGARRKRREAVLATLVVLFGIALLATLPFAVRQWRQTPERGLTLRFPVPPPEKGSFESGLALSPDGHQLAFVAYAAERRQICLRPLNAMEAHPLPGAENGWQPFWSPDGRYLGFFAGGKVKKIDLASGAVQTVCDAPDPRGGAWSRDGVILFSPIAASPLYAVSAEGGVPAAVTALDATEKEVSDRWPYFLPDGRHFLYMGYRSGRPRMPIWIASLDSKDKKRVLESVSMVQYAGPGYLVYVREHSLVAQGFEAERLELKGNPLPLFESLEAEGESGITGRAPFTVAEGGVLAYLASEHRQRQRTWYDRKGKVLGTAGPSADYDEPAMSLDGKYVAVTQGTPGSGS